MNRRPGQLIREINLFNLTHPGFAPLSLTCEKNGPMFYVYLLNNERVVSELTCELDRENISIELLRTRDPTNRGKKYAEKLLGITLWCAKRAGYMRSEAEAMFMYNSPPTKSGRPPSAHLFNKFEFNRANTGRNGTENRSLNLNKNLLGINAVIRSINNSAPKLNGHS
jgi:hypothetical protein